jgi:hypothetical protein
MAETEGAWWSEVEHLREGIERKRAEQAQTTGFERVAARREGRFAKRQDELTSDREIVEAGLAELAAGTTAIRERAEAEAKADATATADDATAPRTGRFDRLELSDPEPISPSALLALDVVWQEPRQEPAEEEQGVFTELVIPGQGVPGRPTVQIRGRGAEGRLLDASARRRPSRPVAERLGPRPDKVALYALLLAIVLIITAVATADASTLPH